MEFYLGLLTKNGWGRPRPKRTALQMTLPTFASGRHFASPTADHYAHHASPAPPAALVAMAHSPE